MMKLRLAFTSLFTLLALLVAIPGTKYGTEKKLPPHATFCLMSEEAETELYNRNLIVHLHGKLDSVELVAFKSVQHGAKIVDSMAHIYISTGVRSYEVHVAPTSYLRKELFALNIGDQLDVDASSVINCSDGILIAGMISSGSKTIQLRDNKGKAKWSAK